MTFRITIGLIALCSSLVVQVQADPQTCKEALVALGEDSIVVGVVGLSEDPKPHRWLFLTETLTEKAVFGGKVIAEREIEPLPGQDVPDIPIDFGAVRIDSDGAYQIASESAEKNRVVFHSAKLHLRCRDVENEPVWFLKLLGPAQDSRGVIYLSAVTGEILRSAWTIREIEDFASASPIFTRTAP